MNTLRAFSVLCRGVAAWMGATFANAHAADAQASLPRLEWRDRQLLPGTLQQATAETLWWNSPLFETAVQIPWASIRRIEMPGPRVPTPDAFRVVLRNGSELFGNPRSLSGDTLSLVSTRFGKVALNKQEVRGIHPLSKDSAKDPTTKFLYSGPQGIEGWIPTVPASLPVKKPAAKAVEQKAAAMNLAGGVVQVNGVAFAGGVVQANEFVVNVAGGNLVAQGNVRINGFALPGVQNGAPVANPGQKIVKPAADETHSETETWIKPGPSGELLFPYWNRSATFGFPLPAQCGIEIRFTSTRRLDFQLQLTGESRQLITLETWDDELVLKNGTQFQSLMPVPPSTRALTLRLFWDQLKGVCSLYSADGSKCAEFATVRPEGERSPGIFLENKGRTLSLDLLRITRWDGADPGPLQERSPGVQTRTAFLPGETSALRDGVVSIRDSSGKEAQVPISEVQDWVLNEPELPAATGLAACLLEFEDGSRILANTPRITNGTLQADHPGFTAPLSCGLGGLRALRVDPPATGLSVRPEDSAEQTDTLSIGGTTFHGKIDFHSGSAPRWKFTSSLEAVAPSATQAFELKTHPSAASPNPPVPAYAFTPGGDVLPAALESVSAEDFLLRPLYAKPVQVPRGALGGMQFIHPDKLLQAGFEEGWQLIKGDLQQVKHAGGELHLPEGAVLWNPGALRFSEISFGMAVTDLSGIRMRLFSDSSPKPSPELQLVLANSDNAGHVDLVAIFTRKEPTSDFPHQESHTRQFKRPETPEKKDHFFQIKLVLRENALDLFAEGVKVHSFNLPSLRPSMGLSLERSTDTRFRFRPVADDKSPVRLNQFQATCDAAKPASPAVDEEARVQALTVPRFRKDTPPKHMLIAHTGDVLRGEIEAASAEHMRFRAGLETLNVPRDRIQALVCVQPAAETKSTPTPPIGRVYRVKKTHLSENDAIRTLLKKLVTEGGEGCAAEWVGEKDALRFVNSEANHQKLLAALNAGGEPASALPALWVELSNGTQLELHGARCSGKAIVGHHLLFGECTLPSADVVRVANTQPGTSSAARFFTREWRLIPALEPVIDGAGNGDSAEGVGTAAPEFTLPTLDGNSFALGAVPGRIVVLDFWATWCGNCTKMIPELLEALAKFPNDKVRFIAVNQGETAPIIQRFMQRRGWSFPVALDTEQNAGKKFHVDGIPHTVIVGPDGKIAWAKVGNVPGAAAEAARTIERLLERQQKAP